jgi:hypothetical protein
MPLIYNLKKTFCIHSNGSISFYSDNFSYGFKIDEINYFIFSIDNNTVSNTRIHFYDFITSSIEHTLFFTKMYKNKEVFSNSVFHYDLLKLKNEAYPFSNVSILHIINNIGKMKISNIFYNLNE